MMHRAHKFYLIVSSILIAFVIFVSGSSHAKKTTPQIFSSFSIELDSPNYTKDEINKLILLPSDRNFSIDEVNQAKSLLEQTGIFDVVELRVDGQHVIFLLHELRFIRKISVSGHYPFLTKKILRLVSLQKGDPFNQDILTEVVLRLEDYFENQGYDDTKIVILTKEDRQYNTIDLKIKISKGKTHHLGFVDFYGNEYFSDRYLKNRLNSFTHFSPAKIRKKLKKIQSKYVSKGFVRANFNIEDMHLNTKSKRIDMTVSIKENRRLLLRFVGNRWFSPQTLDDNVTFYEERGLSRFDLEQSITQLLQFYHNNGFSQVSIEPTISKSDDFVMIVFDIKEGPRSRIKKISFEGNTYISDRKLKKALISETHSLSRQGFFKEEQLFTTDIQTLKKNLINRGYLDAQIDLPTVVPNQFWDLVNISIPLNEGEPYKLSAVEFSGNIQFTSKELLKVSNLKLGKTYLRPKAEKGIEEIQNFYHDKGYPYVKIQKSEIIDSNNHEVSIRYSIDEGYLATVRGIIINGNYETVDHVILNAIKFKTGDIYTYQKMLTAQLNLKRLGIFDFVRITPIGIEDEKSQLDILIKVSERKSITLDVQAGFDSDKLGSGEIIFTKRNVYGLAKQIQMKAIGGFEFDRGELTLYSPRIFGASWNLVNQFYVEYEDDENFNAASVGVSLGVLKKFGVNWTLLLKSEINRLNIFEGQSNQTALTDNLFDSTFSETIASVSFDNLNNFADPTKGVNVVFNTEFNTDLSDPDNNFNITEINLMHFFGLTSNVTLVNSFRFGNILNITDSTRIPAEKLFFMGGNSTVRGFEEDAINQSGGTTSLIYNGELHYRLFGGLKLAGFFDVGSLTDGIRAIEKSTFRESAGVGIRYFTPLGPVRIDYGFVLDKRAGEPGRRFHFSFGYFF